jgi:hypothetical protein
MQIARALETIQQANRYQFKLYQQWDSVQLVSAPMFSEAGRYVWEVSGRASK